jgi:2-methylisocitrate lyase-like PEP mutase family enzyme
MVEGGRTPLCSPDELHALGFDLIVHPVAALLAAARAVGDVYAELRRNGTLRGHLDRLLAFDEFNELVGLGRQYALQERFRSEPE